MDRNILESSYQEYGIESLADVYLLGCELTASPEKSRQPDWDAFQKDLPVFVGNCDCISIVQLFAKEHLGSYERKAAQMIKEEKPLSAEGGIQIGSWKTFVKGLYVDTFALGGDTAVHYGYDGILYLENYRIIPLCMLASNYNGIMEQLLQNLCTFLSMRMLCSMPATSQRNLP